MDHRILFRSLKYCLLPTAIVFFFTFLYFFDITETIKFFGVSKGFRAFLFISELLLVVAMYFWLKSFEVKKGEKRSLRTRLSNVCNNTNNLYYTSNLTGTIIIIKQFDND